VRTDQSFTVSAWVNLQQFSTGNQAILAQDGANVSGFWLGAGLSGGNTRWTLGMADTDTVNPGARVATSAPLTTADLSTWQHVTGVFDALRNEIRLYVNGRPTARSPRTVNGVPVTPWHANGALTVGRAKWNGGQSDHFNGAIDELRVFQGAMTDSAVFVYHNSQVAPRPGTNVLRRDQTLRADEFIRSDVNNYELIMQGDGNLVLYRSDGFPLWDSGTYGTDADRLYVQPDGNVVLYGPDGQVHWHRTQVPLPPSGSIVNPVTGRCVTASSTTDGARFELRACNGTGSRVFELRSDGSVVNPATGKCVAANATTEGAGLELWGCNGMGHQVLVMRPSGSVSNPATGRCVAANSTADGAKLELRACNGGTNQRFEMRPDGSIVNPATGKCVAANATTEGAGLELWGCNGMGHQRFELRYHAGP